MTTLLILWSNTFVFLLLSAFFSASETALFSIPREKIYTFKDTTVPSQKLLFDLLTDGQRTLYLLLLGNLFVNITLTGCIYSVVSFYHKGGSALAAMLIATTLIVVFGEILPKNIALKHNVSIGCIVAPVLVTGKKITTPLLTFITDVNRFFLNYFRLRFRRPSPYVTAAELKSNVIESGKKGIFSNDEQMLLVNLLDRGTVPVAYCMEHRSKLCLYPDNISVTEAREAVMGKKCPKMFVYNSKQEGHVKGKVTALSLFKASPDTLLTHLIEPLTYVPDTMETAEVLGLLFRRECTEAAVVDEYGAFQGVLSIEKGVEYIMHPVFVSVDSYENNEESNPVYNGIYKGDYEVAFMEWLPPSLQHSGQGIRTLSGVITNYLGYIPVSGDKFAIEGWNFYILSASPVKIDTIFIKKRHEHEY